MLSDLLEFAGKAMWNTFVLAGLIALVLMVVVPLALLIAWIRERWWH